MAAAAPGELVEEPIAGRSVEVLVALEPLSVTLR
jgi:hypothetical protein